MQLYDATYKLLDSVPIPD